MLFNNICCDEPGIFAGLIAYSISDLTGVLLFATIYLTAVS